MTRRAEQTINLMPGGKLSLTPQPVCASTHTCSPIVSARTVKIPEDDIDVICRDYRSYSTTILMAQTVMGRWDPMPYSVTYM